MMRRLLSVIPTIAGVSLLVFAFLHAIPGDPVEIMLGESASAQDVATTRRSLGLDRPIPAQLLGFANRLLHGDLGTSIAFRAPVSTVVRERLPATLLLAAVAIVVAVTTAVPLGVVAALFPRSPVDRAARLMSLTGIAVPSFVSGPLLVWIFAIELGWLPVSGNDGPAHVVLPALTLALGMSGLLVRLTRAAMLDTMTADHLRTARAKGAGATRVVLVHALRVALPPIVTVVGLQAGALLAGAVVTETIFAWPGVGRLVVQAIQARDYPLVQGCVLTIGLSYVGVSLLTDLLLTLVDPRLRDEP